MKKLIKEIERNPKATKVNERFEPLQQKVILDDKTKITNTDFISNQYNITPAQVSKICDSLLAAFPYK